MWKMWVLMVGAALLCLGGVKPSSAQVILGAGQQRAEALAEAQINYLQDSMGCQQQRDLAYRAAWATYAMALPRGTSVAQDYRAGGVTVDRDILLREADLQFRECMAQLDATLLRQRCRLIAFTEAQSRRCEGL